MSNNSLSQTIIKTVFEIIKDEDGYHTKYEVINEKDKLTLGDFVKFNCKTIDEAVYSLSDLSIEKLFLEAI